MARSARSWALPCLAALALADAHAGPWEATTPQGLTVRIVQDSFRTRDGYVLDRVYPDGTVDAGFGPPGGTLFSMGPDNEGPAALRLDAQGRPWVAGASAGRGDTLQAVVLRFLPNGLPDVSYAQGGRAAMAPAGRKARALDLAPQADGSTWVAGLVLDSQGQERIGWWRLRADGQVDTGFGLGGLWADDAAGAAEVLELAAAPDGSVALGLRRGQGAAAMLELWRLAPGAAQPGLVARVPDAAATLRWTGGQWQWSSGATALTSAVTQPAGVAPNAAPERREPAASAAPAHMPASAPSAAASGEAGAKGRLPLGMWAALALAGASLLAVALLRGRNNRDKQDPSQR